MAKKKVLFYSLSVEDKEKLNKVDNTSIRSLILDILDKNCINEDGIEHLILNGKDDNLFERITMDVIENDENYLFARLGKLKGNGEVLVRDLKTYTANGIANERTRPETYTYFLLDYNYGILGYLNNVAIPKPDVIKKIFEIYNEKYSMSIENIVNPKTVRDLMNPGSELGKIEYSYKIPNIHILSDLGLDRETVVALDDIDYDTVNIVIRSSPRKKLTKEHKIINNLVELFDRNGKIKDKIFKGNTVQNSSQNYKFDIDNFSTTIDVPKDKVDNGKIKIYSLEEITEQVGVRLKENYKKNRQHILRLAGIE